jgi:hypothetical protein
MDINNNDVINNNNNIKNLIKLYTKSDNNKQTKLKENMIKELQQLMLLNTSSVVDLETKYPNKYIKKKEIKQSSVKLSNLAKLSVNDTNYKSLETNIKTVDTLSEMLSDNIITKIDFNYIECYGN